MSKAERNCGTAVARRNVEPLAKVPMCSRKRAVQPQTKNVPAINWSASASSRRPSLQKIHAVAKKIPAIPNCGETGMTCKENAMIQAPSTAAAPAAAFTHGAVPA